MAGIIIGRFRVGMEALLQNNKVSCNSCMLDHFVFSNISAFFAI